MLTDGRRVSVINAPAGSGKTWVLAAAGRAWAAAGLGRVIGITPSQSARNTLAAGVPESYNSAQFLGHLPGQRGARGPVALRPGDLILMDEASMISNPDLADVVTQADASGAKVILAGDTQQLQAVENGGGMSLLADALGYAQLTEPVRFRAAWEQAASLRLRAGDTSVLAEYDQHGRIRGGEPEQMIDAAAAAYLALTLDGTDTLLMAADHALRRELSRRVREDLIRLGVVAPGPAVRIADGAAASPGDLIICTQNDHSTEAGEPGRTLANGDLLRIEAITKDGLIVRRALDADPRTGQRRWTGQHFLYRNFGAAELGYAVTDHVAQGRTVTAGLAVITGTEDRPHALVALTRGTTINLAYVFTASPKRADPVPGSRPAPELARYDQVHAERAGTSAPATPGAPPGEALAVLSAVLERDGQLLSASQDRLRALTGADHLAILHAIWTAETTAARQQRYQDLLTASLPPGHRGNPGHQAKWLWRTLRAAELAGLDPGQMLAAAIAERDLAGSRDVAAVIDARLRHRLGSAVPLPAGPWSAQVPAIADPERRAYVAEIAALMDARKDRIGEHAAASALPWAVNTLGPVPSHPLDRLDWQRRAAAIGAWRELSGYDHPADPIGPEPVAAAPDLRAAWHEALAALGPADGPDVRGMPDGMLLHLRDTYPLETAWAPQYVGDELRQVRAAAWDARLAAVRAAAEAEAAQRRGQPERSRPAAGAGRQLPRHARRLRRTRSHLRRRDGRPGRLGRRHPAPAAPGRGRRRRTPPPAPRPAVPAAALRRTPARHAGPARRTHPDRGGADPGDRPVDQGPGRPAPRVRRQAGRPAEPDDPRRRPRLRRPRPGLPALASTGPGRHPATAQARDPAIGADPGTRSRGRPGHGGCGLTAAPDRQRVLLTCGKALGEPPPRIRREGQPRSVR